FYIADGSRLLDGTGPMGNPHIGLRISCKPGAALPVVGSRVRVVGIRTVLKLTLDYDTYVNGTLRRAGDIVYVPVVTTRDGADIALVEM
ncbi:MAG: hypothetical protein N3B12_09005, partial [Armatimonadetes bacterium]|nr:hypothetical protein [Armatimonadota bacterium]